ncbi:hypothetical protein BVX98_04750 [bacterium F11]|nr:hypothetical protein BVX98_04750 [bacterium F11]
MKTTLFVFIISLLGLNSPIWSNDAALEQALAEANFGNPHVAIHKLEELISHGRGDARVYQSLGLLYQSSDQNEKAISALEKAVRLSPSQEALYALALLYEANMLHDERGGWERKAKRAWEQFLQYSSPSHPQRSVAERHLNRLRH